MKGALYGMKSTRRWHKERETEKDACGSRFRVSRCSKARQGPRSAVGSASRSASIFGRTAITATHLKRLISSDWTCTRLSRSDLQRRGKVWALHVGVGKLAGCTLHGLENVNLWSSPADSGFHTVVCHLQTLVDLLCVQNSRVTMVKAERPHVVSGSYVCCSCQIPQQPHFGCATECRNVDSTEQTEVRERKRCF